VSYGSEHPESERHETMVNGPSSWEGDRSFNCYLNNFKEERQAIKEDRAPEANMNEIETCKCEVSIEIAEPGNHLYEGNYPKENESRN